MHGLRCDLMIKQLNCSMYVIYSSSFHSCFLDTQIYSGVCLESLRLPTDFWMAD